MDHRGDLGERGSNALVGVVGDDQFVGGCKFES
jgi:hypothetical protein